MDRPRARPGRGPTALRGCLAAAVVAACVLAGALGSSASAAEADTTPPAPFDVVPDAGEYQTGWSVASPYRNIYVTWQVTTDAGSAVHYELSVDDALYRVVSEVGNETFTKRVEVPDGRHTVTVTAIDQAGNRRAATHALDVVVDTVSPVFTSYPRLVLRRGPVSESAYPLRFTWTGSDEGTGLALARIGPDDTCCFAFDPSLTRYDFSVVPRSSTAWRIWLYDGVGRLARTGRDGYVAPVPWSQVRRSSGWQRYSDGDALDGTEWVSEQAGDRVRVRVSGRSVGWVTRKGPDGGRADVLIDGRVVDTVSLYAATVSRPRVVWTSDRIDRDEASAVTIVNRSKGSRSTVGLDALLLQR